MKKIQKFEVYNIKSDLTENWLNLILVNVLVLAFVTMGFFIPVVSFALAIIVMSYLETGLYGYVLQLRRGKKLSFEEIFLPIQTSLKSICLKIIIYAGMFIWGLLLIIPGIIYGLNNSFAKFIYYDNRNLTISEIMAKSKELVYGKRLMIFFAYFAALVVALCGPALAIGISALLSPPTWLFTLLVTFFSLLTTVVFALPFLEMYLASAYTSSLEKEPVKSEKKQINRKK